MTFVLIVVVDDACDGRDGCHRYQWLTPVDATGAPLQNVDRADVVGINDVDVELNAGGDAENDTVDEDANEGSDDDDEMDLATGRCFGGKTGVVIVDVLMMLL